MSGLFASRSSTFLLQSVPVFRTPVKAPAAALFRWHEAPGALQRLQPPWAGVEIRQFEGIRDGNRTILRMGIGPLRTRWVAEHRDYTAGRQFRDVQISGPMKSWEHTHRMESTGDLESELIDEIDYRPPLGRLGEVWLNREIARTFNYRHRITRADVAAHHRNVRGPLRIVISGSTGLIGNALVPFLTAGGHRVSRLVRREVRSADEIEWRPRAGKIEKEKLEGVDVVIHLAGEPVLGLWTEEKRMRIYGSRVDGTRLLAETLAGLDRPPGVFISASGMHFYGDRGDEPLSERSEPGELGFLTAVVRDWEAATAPASDAGIRTVILRNGLVLSPDAGILALILMPFRFGLGGRIGPADQYMSWIALDDMVHAIYHAIYTRTLSGPVNLGAPEPVTAAEMAKTVGRVLHRPALMNVPPRLVRTVGRTVAEEMLLASIRMIPERLIQSDYEFLFPDLEAALRHGLGR
jgi:uncharacterized protein